MVPGETENDHGELGQNSPSPAQDLDPGIPDYVAGTAAVRPCHKVKMMNLMTTMMMKKVHTTKK
jgi:hypothetical protein